MSSVTQRHQAIFFSVVCVAGLALLVLFPRLSFPIASAYVAAVVLAPVQEFYRALPRSLQLATLAMLLLSFVLFAWPLAQLASATVVDLRELSRELPQLEFTLRQKSAELRSWLMLNFNLRIDVDPIEFVVKKFRKDGSRWIVDLPKVMGNLLEWLILTPVFTWFFLHESTRLKRGFLRLIPNQWFERSYMLFHQFNGRFGGYIFAKTIEATILGVVLLLGLSWIGYPYASLLAIVGGVTNIVPYVGPLLGWGVALGVSLIQQPLSTEAIAAMTAVYAVANFIDMALVFPLLVSRIVNLHPLVVVVSVIIGSEVGGLVGMIVGVPVATFLKLVFVDIHKTLYAENLK